MGSMNIDLGIMPSCSEATIRLNLNGQNKKKIQELIEKLELEMTEEGISAGEWDDDTKKKEFELSEGYVEEKNIFGTNVLEINGDAPYNFHDEINQIIDRYLPDVEREWSE
jgi:hypothetical protein